MGWGFIGKAVGSAARAVTRPVGELVGAAGSVTRAVTKDIPILKNIGSGIDDMAKSSEKSLTQKDGIKAGIYGGLSFITAGGYAALASGSDAYKTRQEQVASELANQAAAQEQADQTALASADAARARDARIRARQEQLSLMRSSPGRSLFTSTTGGTSLLG